MASIFNVSYQENLRRIQNKSKLAENTGTSLGERKDFSILLSEAQKDQKLSIPSKTTNPPESYISNFSLVESSKTDEIIPQKLSRLNFSIREAIESKKDDINTVKNMTNEVKILQPTKVSYSVSGIKQSNFKEHEIKDIITTAGKYHGIDPFLGIAVAQAESSLKPDAVSSDGNFSKGIFQLLDSTAMDMVDRFGVEEKYNPFDPGMNAYLGTGYLKYLFNAFSAKTILKKNLVTHPAKTSSDLEKLAVASFNAGEGTVARAQEKAKKLGNDPGEYSSIDPHLPQQTRQYVARVQMYKQKLSSSHV